MVSSSHEAMHRIFQEDPGIFSRTFDRLGVHFAEPVSVSLLPTDLSETRPLERRVDTLLRIDTAHAGSYLLAVEAQGRRDADKPGSWAYYMAHLYEKYQVPPVLLVVCQEEGTARWASGPFDLGRPHWKTLTLRPLVLGPHNVPVIREAAEAAADIPMATFSAITHSRHADADTMLKALATALKTLDPGTALVFRELTELGLGTSPAAETWRDLMAIPLSFFQSKSSLAALDHAREEWRREGRAEDILLILEQRGVGLSDDVRERITGCEDMDLLRLWLGRAVTAERAEEIFGEPGEPGED